MIFPFVVPLLFPASFLAIVISLAIVEPQTKWERIITFIPYLNVLYVLLVGINKAIWWIRNGV